MFEDKTVWLTSTSEIEKDVMETNVKWTKQNNNSLIPTSKKKTVFLKTFTVSNKCVLL